MISLSKKLVEEAEVSPLEGRSCNVEKALSTKRPKAHGQALGLGILPVGLLESSSKDKLYFSVHIAFIQCTRNAEALL